MRTELPDCALGVGFMNQPAGTHTSRTIMLSELRRLMDTAGDRATYGDYRALVVESNVTGKSTFSTRQKTLRHLRELYALSGEVALFGALRSLWSGSPKGQPMLALLCCVARDPLLRATADSVLQTPEGAELTSEVLANAIEAVFPGRLRPDTLARTGRNCLSSWTQSGHLRGRARKIRDVATTTPESTAYSLLLGYLCGVRGDMLFRTLWTRLTDAPEHVLRGQAEQAGRLGYLDYRHAGGLTEVTFTQLLSRGVDS